MRALWKAGDVLIPWSLLFIVWQFGLHVAVLLTAATYVFAVIFVLGWAWGENHV